MRVIVQRGEYHSVTLSNVITAVVGTVSSSSSEQEAGILESARNIPVVDMATTIIRRMSDDSFHQRISARRLIDENELLTPYARKHHTVFVHTAGTLYVEEEEIEYGALTCFMRATPTSASYNIQVTTQFVYSCDCKHGSDYKRPCAHVLAAIF
eukprot:IDg8512t1